MVLLVTRVRLEMQFCFDMVGIHHAYQLSVFVGGDFQWTMHSVVVEAAIHP